MLMFLKAVGEAVVAKALKVVKEVVPFGDVVYEVGADVIDRYRKAKREAKLATDAQEVISAKMEVIREEAKQIAREVAAGHSEEIVELVEAYLTQVPAAITQSLKRPDDPSGTTLPAGFSVNGPEDVARMLPPRVPRFRPGVPLPGKAGWVLDRLLGVGGFGEVWFARHDRMVSLSGAVKFCFGQTGRDLIHEADLIDRVMQAGSHPNIVPLKDVHLEGDAPWIMFEYVAGGTLTDWIHALAGKPHERRLPLVTTAVRQLVNAVAYFHGLSMPIIHRDLKPSNILLDTATKQLRITDFGIGSITAQKTHRQEHLSQGTRGGRLLSCLYGSHTQTYSSPQQRAGAAPDPRDDIHALGVIAYQMLTGKLDGGPGTGAMRTLKRCGVPDDLADLLLRCASEELDDRPEDGNGLKAAFAATTSRASEQGSNGEAQGGQKRIPAQKPTASAQSPNEGRGRDSATSTPAKRPIPIAVPITNLPKAHAVTKSEHAARTAGADEGKTSLKRQSAGPAPITVAIEAGEQREIAFPGGILMRFAWCPAGSFLMGSPQAENSRASDEVQHEVRLTCGFWVGVHVVTQQQWISMMPEKRWRVRGDLYPASQVSWNETQIFCDALKRVSGIQLRLPTEAQWEYAARGGTTTPFYWGSELNGSQANCAGRLPYGTREAGQALLKLTPVGSYAASYPHPWGLADVIGNVWEWCQDWYAPYLGTGLENPTGPEVGAFRVLRGGSFSDFPRDCRAACRRWNTPDHDDFRGNIGFRVVAEHLP